MSCSRTEIKIVLVGSDFGHGELGYLMLESGRWELEFDLDRCLNPLETSRSYLYFDESRFHFFV